MIFWKENYKWIILCKTYVCLEVQIKMYFPYDIVKCFEKMIALYKNYWNNCTVAHIPLISLKLTGWFIILCMNVAQLLKHFISVIDRCDVLAYYCFSSFYGDTLQSGPGPGPSKKADPGPLEKADPILKFNEWVTYDKFEGEYPNKAFLVPNLGIFIFSRNFPVWRRVLISNMTILF